MKLKTMVAIAVLGLVMAHGSRAQDARTSQELRALTPSQADKVARADLLSLLKPVKGYPKGMRRRVGAVGFDTEPVGTPYAGLCRKDELYVNYAPVEDASRPEHQPLRPYGVEAQASFHFLRAPKADADKTATELTIWDEDCAALDDRDDIRWFTAQDDQEAMQGARLLLDALAAVRAGTLKSQPCPSLDAKTYPTCEQAILTQARLDTIESVERCDTTWNVVCYRIMVAGDLQLTLKAAFENNETEHGPIESILIEQFIIVT
jgi:hypothetical protein